MSVDKLLGEPFTREEVARGIFIRLEFTRDTKEKLLGEKLLGKRLLGKKFLGKQLPKKMLPCYIRT